MVAVPRQLCARPLENTLPVMKEESSPTVRRKGPLTVAKCRIALAAKSGDSFITAHPTPLPYPVSQPPSFDRHMYPDSLFSRAPPPAHSQCEVSTVEGIFGHGSIPTS
jgi:hypothetical protein